MIKFRNKSHFATGMFGQIPFDTSNAGSVVNFPQVIGSITGVSNTDLTSRNITLPTGSDGTLVLIVASDGTPTITMSGWDKVLQANAETNGNSLAVFSRTATGSDPVAVATSASERVSWVCLRFSGVGSVTGTAQNTNNNLSTNGNPPLHTLVQSTKSVWLACLSLDYSTSPSVTAVPTDYNNLLVTAPSATSALCAVARQEIETDSEDPDTFTHGSETWCAATVAVSA